jgi:hypothetical protein
VNNERARAAGLMLTDPAATMRNIRAWARKNLAPAISPEQEKELIRIARIQRC